MGISRCKSFLAATVGKELEADIGLAMWFTAGSLEIRLQLKF